MLDRKIKTKVLNRKIKTKSDRWENKSIDGAIRNLYTRYIYI